MNTSMVQPWPPLDHALTDCLPRPGTLRRYRKQSDGETHAESHLHLPSNRSCHRGRSEHRQPDALVGSHGDPALAMRVLWNATCVSDRKRFPFATVVLERPQGDQIWPRPHPQWFGFLMTCRVRRGAAYRCGGYPAMRSGASLARHSASAKSKIVILSCKLPWRSETSMVRNAASSRVLGVSANLARRTSISAWRRLAR